MVRNDWWCKPGLGGCGRVFRNRVLPSGEAPECHAGALVTLWDHGQPPATDLHAPEFNHATGKFHSSSRETQREVTRMARQWSAKTGLAWDPILAGDPVGGARPDHRIREIVLSDGKLHQRTSSMERVLARQRQMKRGRKPWKAIPSAAAAGPRRVTRDQMIDEKRSPVWK